MAGYILLILHSELVDLLKQCKCLIFDVSGSLEIHQIKTSGKIGKAMIYLVFFENQGILYFCLSTDFLVYLLSLF